MANGRRDAVDQDEKCYACGRVFRANSHGYTTKNNPTVLTLDGMRVFVGNDCYKRISAAGSDGYQPPKDGPQLWTTFDAPAEALTAAGITTTYS